MSAGLELLSTDEMSRVDQLAVEEGRSSLALMECAGRAVANEAMRMVPIGARIAVLCGPGNNGGDGYVAARMLRERGYRVSVASVVDVSRLQGDAAATAALWNGPVEPILDGLTPNVFGDATLVIDAMFGAGVSRPLAGGALAIARHLNDGRRAGALRVLAVDVPSGLSGTSGQRIGDESIEADRTITFFRRKPGHLLLPGRHLCGDVVLADIGIPPSTLASIRPQTYANAPDLWRKHWPTLEATGHKYNRGHVVVVSGGSESTGAARLGAASALRIGAGLVTLVGSPAATLINAAHVTAIMTRSISGARSFADVLMDARLNSVLIGPGAGVGAETVALASAALASTAAVVLDADAITSFAGDGSEGARPKGAIGFLGRATEENGKPDELFERIKGRNAPCVLTPHEGEFKRVFGAVTGAKLDRARIAAKRAGAVIVLKGPDTVIAAPDGRAAINENAPPTLATAGSGDVLAGFVAGLVAQAMPAFEAACAAVWLHGACATSFGPGLTAEDLSVVLPRVLKALEDAN